MRLLGKNNCVNDTMCKVEGHEGFRRSKYIGRHVQILYVSDMPNKAIGGLNNDLNTNKKHLTLTSFIHFVSFIVKPSYSFGVWFIRKCKKKNVYLLPYKMCKEI